MRFASKNVMGLALLLAVVGIDLPVQAALVDIRVDFNDRAPTPTGWYCVGNQTDTSTVHNLTDFNTGLATGITLQITNAFAGSTTNQDVTWSNPFAPWADLLAMRDYAALGNGDYTAQIVISGLDRSSTYVVGMLAYRDSPTADNSFLINGVAGVIVDGGGSTTAWNTKRDGVTNQDFMQWLALAPDINGRFVIDVTTSANYAFLNGMRLASTVPEPSSAILLLSAAVGGWCLSARMRRRPRTQGSSWGRNGPKHGQSPVGDLVQ